MVLETAVTALQMQGNVSIQNGPTRLRHLDCTLLPKFCHTSGAVCVEYASQLEFINCR